MNHTKHKQQAVVLIIIIACLSIAGMLLIAGVKMAYTGHVASQSFNAMNQSQLLIESGLQRAAAQLSTDEKYSGETWRIPSTELGGTDAGLVKIEVKPVSDKSNLRLVKVEADFPDDPQDRVKYTKELTIELQ